MQVDDRGAQSVPGGRRDGARGESSVPGASPPGRRGARVPATRGAQPPGSARRDLAVHLLDGRGEFPRLAPQPRLQGVAPRDPQGPEGDPQKRRDPRPGARGGLNDPAHPPVPSTGGPMPRLPDSPSDEARERLTSLASEVVEEVLDGLYRRHPEWEARYGTRGRAYCREDLHYHLEYVRACL